MALCRSFPKLTSEVQGSFSSVVTNRSTCYRRPDGGKCTYVLLYLQPESSLASNFNEEL